MQQTAMPCCHACLQDPLLPRLLPASFSPVAGTAASPKAAAAVGSPAPWMLTSAARAPSAGVVYPQSPTAVAAAAGGGIPASYNQSVGGLGFRNSISATSPSMTAGGLDPGMSGAAAAAAHAIATAAAAAVAREMEDRLALAEGRAVAAERAALEAARAAELSDRRVNDVTSQLARANADIGDSRGRQDAAVAMQQQVRDKLKGFIHLYR